ncbi:MAG: hypothetical protein IPN72_13790 [Saprospiraceae bacterium]|nr:hypothetical protein [Saprospiraceae bacterium]
MMNMKSSNKKSLVRYMMIIPLVLVLGIIFASSKMSDAADVEVVTPLHVVDSLPEGYDGEKHDGVILVYTNKLDEIPENAEFYINEKKVVKSEMDQLDPTAIKLINVVGKRARYK